MARVSVVVVSYAANFAVNYLPPSVLETMLSRRRRSALLKKAAVLLLVLAIVARYWSKRSRAARLRAKRLQDKTAKFWDYSSLKSLVKTQHLPLPSMVVDLDAFESNLRILTLTAQQHGKAVRLATKSVRVPALIRHAVLSSNGAVKGLMCFSAKEAKFLADLQDSDLEIAAPTTATPVNHATSASAWNSDLLVAYPTVQAADLEAAFEVASSGKRITLMVDCPEHVDVLEAFMIRKKRLLQEELSPASSTSGDSGTLGLKLRVCIDVDMSLRLLGDWIHIGAHRSPCRSMADFVRLVSALKATSHLQLVGVMGYEAQIAGLPDSSPFDSFMNPVKKLVKAVSYPNVKKQRATYAAYLKKQNIAIEFFNGGGSGNVDMVADERALTEITIGSGLLQSTLFDHYQANSCVPAFAFALPCTRIPQKGVVTCQSGGFVASGAVSQDKAPSGFLPPGLKPFPNEGFGEVQTPLCCPPSRGIAIGDPIFFRPAKSGEIAEHFNTYALKRGARLVGHANTYRGFGKAFH